MKSFGPMALAIGMGHWPRRGVGIQPMHRLFFVCSRESKCPGGSIRVHLVLGA